MIRHLAGIAEIVEDIESTIRFYREVLGLAVQHQPGDGYATLEISGVLHYGLWSRRAAAEAVFGNPDAADRIPLGFTVGFEVDSVAESSEAMQSKGWSLLQSTKTEGWGQTVSRFLAPSGALAEISETPWARKLIQQLQAEATESKTIGE
jgi:catechol 2,3-dioxygenase-like lactoylglutathione lyase family enzyme